MTVVRFVPEYWLDVIQTGSVALLMDQLPIVMMVTAVVVISSA